MPMYTALKTGVFFHECASKAPRPIHATEAHSNRGKVMRASQDHAYRRFTVFGLGAVPVLAGSVGIAASAGAGEPIFYRTAAGSHDAAATDANRDGAVDIIVASIDGAITIRLNDGQGGFDDAVMLDHGGGDYIDVGDLDGDFDVDLVTANGATVNVLFNDGQGGFSDPVIFEVSNDVYGVELVDVTGDGMLDLALSEHGPSRASFELYFNDGDGSFTFAAAKSFDTRKASRFSVTSGDLDDDGDQDVVTMNQGVGTSGIYYATDIHVLINSDNGTNWAHRLHKFDQDDFVRPAWHLRSGDIDRDGDIELVYNDGGSLEGDGAAVWMLDNNGTGHFTRLLAWLPTWDKTTGIALGDMDGNGGVDEIAVADVGFVDFEYRAYVRLDSSARRSAGSDPNHWGSLDVEVPDVSGDGIRDIVALVAKPEPGVLVTLNTFTPDRPVLSQTDLIRGESTTFTVAGAAPNERVYFLHSLGGIDSTPGIEPLGFISLDLAPPLLKKFAGARADGAGVAEVVVTVPSGAPLGAIAATQAVIRRGPGGADSVKTNFITAPIRE